MKTRSPYIWTPGVGPDPEALARLLAHAGERPREAMGEGWFMGERKMFDYLCTRDLCELGWAELMEPIEEIGRGRSFHGQQDEWDEWFPYLLPRVLAITLEANNGWAQQLLFSTLVTQYPDGMGKVPYDSFRLDVLDTLGRAVMDGRNWVAAKTVAGGALFEMPETGDSWSDWTHLDASIAAALFLCLKYLEPGAMAAWARSVFAIDDPHWRAQLMLWFTRAEPMLGASAVQPGAGDSPELPCWQGSEWLKGNYNGAAAPTPFLSAVNKAAFKAVAADALTLDVLEGWQAAIEAIDYLSAEHGCTPAEVRKVIESL